MSGWAFIRQMNDAIKSNHRFLRKRKSLKEIREDEITERPSTFDNPNFQAIDDRLKKGADERHSKRESSRFKSIAVLVLLPICLLIVAWYTYLGLFIHKKEIDSIDPFKVKYYSISQNKSLKAEYFRGGPIAAETELEDGRRHGNSISYYPTGEIFRRAEYNVDELIWELYFFRSGETIKNFPRIDDQKTYKMEFSNENLIMKLSFHDGKIIAKQFNEYPKRN